jgi:thymidine kinase
MTYPLVKPGVLEVYCGPMKSGKTREIINRIEKLRFMDSFDFIMIKPNLDTRDSTIKTRFGDLSYECIFIDEARPKEILEKVKDKHNLVIIDEIQFFEKGIIGVVEKLVLANKNVIVGGLDLDFRGEPFGQMPYLLSIADEIHKLAAVCEYPRCSGLATRTQRLIKGEPAHYDSSTIVIDGGEDKYEPRCIKHHIVPGKQINP